MAEDIKNREEIDYSQFPSPAEWKRQFRTPLDPRTIDNVSLIRPDWEKNAEARKKHPEHFGKNNRVTIVWMRHGEKNADDTLKPEGVKQAQEEMDLVIANGFKPSKYGVIHTLASYTGPKNRFGLPRASETAQAAATRMLFKDIPKRDIQRYKNEHGFDPLIYPGMPEYSPELSFGDAKFKVPAERDSAYHAAWVKAYADSSLLSGEDLKAAQKIVEEAGKITETGARRKKFAELGPILKKADKDGNVSAEQRLALVNKASNAALDAMAHLNTPEGEGYRNESAGAMAHLLLHYLDVAQKMESGNAAALIAGGHGEVNWEPILQQALIWKNPKTGKEQVGFDSFDEIGGAIRPAESIVVDIRTDKKGNPELSLSFTRKDRPLQGSYRLDHTVLKKFAGIWADMHKDDPKEMTPREYFEKHIVSR